MGLSVNIQIAKTHLFAKKKQTIIASLGVMFGIGMFILMTGFMTGVNNLLERTTLQYSPHVRIYNDVEVKPKSIVSEYYPDTTNWIITYHQKAHNDQINLKNALHIVNEIKENPKVLGVSMQLASQVFFSTGAIQLPGSVLGVNILDEDKLYNIKEKFIAGSMNDLITRQDAIVIGQEVAEKLGLNVGDKITTISSKGNTMVLRIVGIFNFGIRSMDNGRAYASINTVQKLMSKDARYITDIHIKLKDFTQAKSIAKQWHNQFAYKAEDWETANATILASNQIRNIMTVIVVSTLLIVAGFGIYNIMSMTIYDKMKDIAILKATGFGGKDIVRIFLYQALFIGLMGGFIGLCVGYGLSYLLSITPFEGGKFLNIKTFPINFDIRFYIAGIGFGILTTVLAGYFPARKASKIDPVQILRG